MDRRLAESAGSLWAPVAAQPALGAVPITVPRHDDAPPRTAVMTLRTGSRHAPLSTPSAGGAIGSVNAVWGRETAPPDGIPSDLNGCMLTTLSVADRAAAEPVLQYRWMTYLAREQPDQRHWAGFGAGAGTGIRASKPSGVDTGA